MESQNIAYCFRKEKVGFIFRDNDDKIDVPTKGQ